MANKEVTSHQRRRRFSLRLATLIILGFALLLAGTVAFLSPTGRAHAATWNQVWSDEFNGSANTGVS
ncbi:MAG TPA: hypothetical protein VHD63_16960, partial [Ktedonobacteraceae bacterium]|nr:hypothetical protein [Ktedonobacteraceae bacterium]